MSAQEQAGASAVPVSTTRRSSRDPVVVNAVLLTTCGFDHLAKYTLVSEVAFRTYIPQAHYDRIPNKSRDSERETGVFFVMNRLWAVDTKISGGLYWVGKCQLLSAMGSVDYVLACLFCLFAPWVSQSPPPYFTNNIDRNNNKQDNNEQ